MEYKPGFIVFSPPREPWSILARIWLQINNTSLLITMVQYDMDLPIKLCTVRQRSIFIKDFSRYNSLTHWGRVTHICVGNLTIIDSDNGLSPGRRQAITWTNVGILLIGTLGTNFSEMLIEIHTFSFKKTNLKMSSGKWRPFFLGLNVLSEMGNQLIGQ